MRTMKELAQERERLAGETAQEREERLHGKPGTIKPPRVKYVDGIWTPVLTEAEYNDLHGRP